MCLYGKWTSTLDVVHEASPELRTNSVYIGMGGVVNKPLKQGLTYSRPIKHYIDVVLTARCAEVETDQNWCQHYQYVVLMLTCILCGILRYRITSLILNKVTCQIQSSCNVTHNYVFLNLASKIVYAKTAPPKMLEALYP